MAMSRFVRPDTVTLPLSDGDTITIRKELNTGESRAMFDRARIPDSTPPRTDPILLTSAMLIAYLLDWTFVDDMGTRVEIRGLTPDELATVLDTLRQSTVQEMIVAISAHISTQAAMEKKILNGEIAS